MARCGSKSFNNPKGTKKTKSIKVLHNLTSRQIGYSKQARRKGRKYSQDHDGRFCS